ncbi:MULTISPECIES: hypothetical protein [unclassified Bartonella]|uniref:hypothetical protein n=1 Tax=unclassified Bartonella TaxID=2645622 RepID=UPI0035CFB5CB
MHHTLTDISTPPFFHPLPPFRFPPFSQGATSHALGKQTSTEQLQKKLNEKQTLWQQTTPPTQAPQLMPQQGIPQQDPSMHHTLRHPPHLLASFLLSTFLLFPRRHFPCSWQTNINTAISEGLSESQAHWQAKKFRDHWQEKSGKEALK